MQGQYINPHALQPGEILSPSLLFERYLDWHEYKERVARAWKKGQKCDYQLFTQHLCCQDHMRLQQEYDTFFRYFALLEMVEEGEHGFSLSEAVSVIKKYKMVLTDDLKGKLRKYWRSDSNIGFGMLAQ